MFTRDPEPDPVRAAPISKRVLIALALVAVLAAGGLWATRLLSQDADTAVVTPTSALPTVPAGGHCAGWGSGSPEEPTAVTGVTWSVIGSVEAPAAPGVGPANLDPLRWCYAHTPAGALYAAVNFIAQQATIAPPVLATYLMADTAERGRIQGVVQESVSVPVLTDTSPVLRWRGYHVITYTDAVATIDVAHEWGEHIIGAEYTLLWENGDWKLVYPESLEFAQRILPGLDPSYWTTWPAVTA